MSSTFAGCQVPVDARQRTGESGGAARTALKMNPPFATGSVREETVRNISRFAAVFCGVIHTWRGKLSPEKVGPPGTSGAALLLGI